MLALLMMVPPMTANTKPTSTYAIAIDQLKILASKMTEAKSTSGEEIKKEKVTPSGKPELVKPINSGIDEQEQNGVIVPIKAPVRFALKPCIPPRIFRVRSGGK